MANKHHEGRGRPRVQNMSLRRALAEVMTDEDMLRIAESMKSAAVNADGTPNMEIILPLLKHVPHVPPVAALERARALVAAGKDKLADEALACLYAHAVTDGTGEASLALVDALAKHATATKAMADAPNASAAPITINVMQHPDTVSTTATVTTEPRTDEVKK